MNSSEHVRITPVTSRHTRQTSRTARKRQKLEYKLLFIDNRTLLVRFFLVEKENGINIDKHCTLNRIQFETLLQLCEPSEKHYSVNLNRYCLEKFKTDGLYLACKR